MNKPDPQTRQANPSESHDVVIVGAGAAGLYTIYRMREYGFSVKCFEAGSDVGGTWYWNRYPGARVDIESVEYCYSFSDELQQDWEWPERFSAQPELLNYFQSVARRFDLYKHIEFGARVASVAFDKASQRWLIRAEGGRCVSAKFCVMATGFLSAPNKPSFKGVDDFKGEQYHTARWPREKTVDFSGKRVGVIGTGSSGVQAIPLIAKEAKHLYVFQRTPGYCIPARNHPMPKDYLERVKKNYAKWREHERYKSPAGIVAVNYDILEDIPASALDFSDEERKARYQYLYDNGALALYLAFRDLATNMEANKTVAEFVRQKIRERVNDPVLAEKLIPDYPIMMKRLIADTNYYETYARDNVTLVDVKETPIERITEKGVKVGDMVYELDAIVFATGFDASTGELTRMNVAGPGGHTLKDHWKDGARTFMGLMCTGFPNLFFIDGPGGLGAFYSPMLVMEEQIEWLGECLDWMRANGVATIDATPEAEAEWERKNEEALKATLFPTVDSWYIGSNIPGKSRAGLLWFGGIDAFRAGYKEAKTNGYHAFRLEREKKSTGTPGTAAE